MLETAIYYTIIEYELELRSQISLVPIASPPIRAGISVW